MLTQCTFRACDIRGERSLHVHVHVVFLQASDALFRSDEALGGCPLSAERSYANRTGLSRETAALNVNLDNHRSARR